MSIKLSIELPKTIANLKNNWYQDELNNYAESFGVDNPESISLYDLQESNYKDLRSLISCKDEVNLILSDKEILVDYIEILWEYISDKNIPEIMSRYEKLEGVK
jgi:hypothetical protein